MSKYTKLQKMKADIKKELKPHFDKVLSLSDEERVKLGEEFVCYLEQCSDLLPILNSFDLDQDLKNIRTSIKEQLFLLFHYLGLVESIGNWTTDILIMLLVRIGIDFHIKGNVIRHVYSFDELQESYVSLQMKLDFLKKYEIKTYPKIINKELRNEIAHFKFEVKNDRIIIRDKEVWEVIFPELLKIKVINELIIEMFKELGRFLGI